MDIKLKDFKTILGTIYRSSNKIIWVKQEYEKPFNFVQTINSDIWNCVQTNKLKKNIIYKLFT